MDSRNLGRVIGLILIVIAAASIGYVVGVGSADTTSELVVEPLERADDGPGRSDDQPFDTRAPRVSPSGGEDSESPDQDGSVAGQDETPVEEREPTDDSRGADGNGAGPSASGLPPISVDDLPDEAITTLVLIDDDGPFPYRKDGSTFHNREGLLPDRERGYYREYTVDTPGSPDRGARRIVGGARGERYYTSDHYNSFSEIVDW